MKTRLPRAETSQEPNMLCSRVGMLRQNNQHTPARAAVLAAVLSQPECAYDLMNAESTMVLPRPREE